MKWACVVLSLPASCLCGGAVVNAQESSTPPPATPLQQCAALCDPSERLVCYDRLAAAERPAVSGASGASGASAGGSASPRAGPAPVAPQAATKESFGLYTAEHPAPPAPAKSLTARIVGVRTSPDGRSTVELEGGQVWLLDELDPLLATGDSVTVSRASFGSFRMTTPKGRTHRARRLR